MKKSHASDIQALSDEALLSRSIEEPSLFGVLLKRYHKAFLRRAERMLHDKDEAEDAAQEAFVSIYRHASDFLKKQAENPSRKFSSWAHTILLNGCVSRLRQGKREMAFSNLSSEWQEFQSDPKATRDDDGDAVQSVLARMPSILSRILRLHLIERRPQREIAEMEGISLGATKMRIYRAKQYFKKLSTQFL
jgi:RNA polymerase sigma-70 factor (ECF subfamily)